MQEYTRSRQNKIQLISLLVFILLLIGVFFWYRSATTPGSAAEAAGESGSAKVADSKLYMGVSFVDPAKVRALWPQAKDKPMLVEFHSRYCLDCKKMAPVIQSAAERHPGVVFQAYEIAEDKKANLAVFNAFRPATVPVLIFIKPDGRIQNVLYNYQTPETIDKNMRLIGAVPQKNSSKAAHKP